MRAPGSRPKDDTHVLGLIVKSALGNEFAYGVDYLDYAIDENIAMAAAMVAAGFPTGHVLRAWRDGNREGAFQALYRLGGDFKGPEHIKNVAAMAAVELKLDGTLEPFLELALEKAGMTIDIAQIGLEMKEGGTAP